MSLADRAIPPEVTAAGEALLSGIRLIVPDEAEAARKGGFARFDEVAVVEKGSYEDKIGKDGESLTVFKLKLKILPALEGESPNTGKTWTAFFYYNFGALAGNQDACGTKNIEGQKTMSRMTATKLKKLAVAMDIWDPEVGLDGQTMEAMFPSDESGTPSVLEGEKFIVTFSDDNRAKSLYKGQSSQNLDDIVKAPEGI